LADGPLLPVGRSTDRWDNWAALLQSQDGREILSTIATPQPERILVEDDEETIREIMADMLTSAGYECRMVETPAAAFDALKSGKPFDLVCCGVTEWPDEDFERMVKTFPKVPVVVSSGRPDISFMLKVLHMGAYDFVLRPFEREQLIFAVRRALDYRRLKLENLFLRDRLGVGSGIEIPRNFLKLN
jgi:DNA-binding NtrC family response regulator